MKIIGIIPARMKASRFPGKPLHKIIDRSMISHVWGRANLYDKWDHLSVATCDREIIDHCKENKYDYVLTGSHHVRALDRVEEAVSMINDFDVDDNDIIINVQGDEPMIHPEMFEVLVNPIINNSNINATILGMSINNEEIWRDPDTVKLICNEENKVLYTTRAAVPYNNNIFSEHIGAIRIYGLFAFRWKYLKLFSSHPETKLEKLESCDSNRVLDMDFDQYVSKFPYVESFSVDSPKDINRVEKSIINDKYWGAY